MSIPRRRWPAVLTLAVFAVSAAGALAATPPPAGPTDPAPIAPEEYAARRARVAEAVGPDGMLVLRSAPERPRNGDVVWPFRQDDDLLYLTGVAEPDTTLVMLPGEEELGEVLFALDRDPQAELWTGPIPSHEELAAASGIEQVDSARAWRSLVTAALDGDKWGESDLYGYYRRPAAPRFLEAVRAGRAEVWLDLGMRWGLGGGGEAGPALELAREIRETWPEVAIRNATPLLESLREVKSPAELALLERAIAITEEAIRAGMRRAATAETENQLRATIEFTFHDLGACCWGFPSIVAAGPNTTILHYEAGVDPVPRDGLVLFDVGAEVAGYTADVTRTFPADGTFSDEQRAVYRTVYDASEAAIAEMRPGTSFADIHLRTLERIGTSLVELGLATENVAEQAELYLPHGVGHPLGLQVHDVFDRTRTLEPGMVWTIEPGIYVRPDDVRASEAWGELSEEERERIDAALARYAGIGVRIEDDVLITEGAPRVLSDGTPRTVEEIERFMAQDRPGG